MDDYRSSDVTGGNVTGTTAPSLEEPLPAIIAMTVYMSLLAVLGLIGNTLVITSVVISPRLRNASYAFIVNLSVADLAVNVLVIPLTIVSQFLYGWPRNPFWCHCIFYLFLLSIGLSLITLAAIAANRYCLVSRSRNSYQRYCNRRAVTILFICIWSSSLLLAFLPEFGFGKIHYDPQVRICYADNSDIGTFWYLNVLIIYVIIVGMIFTPFLYWLTFRAVRASKMRVRNIHRSSRFAFHANANFQPRMLRPEEIRLTKIMVIIYVLIMVCWFPLVVMHFFKHAYVIPVTLERLSLVLVFTNSSINPYLYAGLNHRFRQAYRRILLCGHRSRATVSVLNV